MNVLEHEKRRLLDPFTAMVTRVRFMTPVKRKLLLTIHSMLQRTELKGVSRAEIAAAIHHPKMHRHDLKVMNELIKEKLVKAEQVSLAKPEGNMVRGFEYRYSMDAETFQLLNRARNPQPAASQRQKASNLPNRKKAAPIEHDWLKDLPWHERLYDWFLSLFGW